jgi:hypothetical protein
MKQLLYVVLGLAILFSGLRWMDCAFYVGRCA